MDNRTCIKLLQKAGQMLLESGAETYRAEDAALYMYRAVAKGDIQVFAVPTMMIVNIETEEGEMLSDCRRIRRRSTDLGKIEKINHVVRQVSHGHLTPESALKALEAVDRKEERNPFLTIAVMSVAAGAFALLLGGGILEVVFAFLGSFLAQTIGLFFRGVSMYNFFNSILGGLVPSLLMVAVGRYLPTLQQETVVVASMLILFPGVSTVIAIRDMINGDFVSGVSRGAEALLTAFGLALGASMIFLPGVG